MSKGVLVVFLKDPWRNAVHHVKGRFRERSLPDFMLLFCLLCIKGLLVLLEATNKCFYVSLYCL